MDSISLACPNCETILEFPADQAGNVGECGVCGNDVQIPKPGPKPKDPRILLDKLDTAAAVAKERDKPPAAAKERDKPPAADDDEDEDGGTGYGLVEVVREKKKLPVEPIKKKKKEQVDPSLRRKKKLHDADKWHVVRGGLSVMSTAALAWAVIYFLQMAVVVFGCTLPGDYNPAKLKVLNRIHKADDLAENVRTAMDRPRFALALVYGTEYLTAFQSLQCLLAIISVFPVVLFVLGYFACSRSPNRFGMREQAKGMIVLACVNTGILLLFKILPLTTLMPYTPLAYYVPELATLTVNKDRFTPIPVMWTQFPFFDYLLTFMFIMAKAMEGALGGIYLCTMGFIIKDDELRDAGAGLVQLALGAGFALIVYHCFSLCGGTPVLVDTLRVVYLAAVGFQFYFILRYMYVLSYAGKTLDRKMVDMTEDELRWKDEDDPIEEDEDDEDDEPRKKKNKKKKPRASDDAEENGDGKRKRKRKRQEDEDEDDDDDDD